jgi:hypothetical protein
MDPKRIARTFGTLFILTWRGPVAAPQPLEEPGGSLDVGEQERDGAGGQLHVPPPTMISGGTMRQERGIERIESP